MGPGQTSPARLPGPVRVLAVYAAVVLVLAAALAIAGVFLTVGIVLLPVMLVVGIVYGMWCRRGISRPR